MTSYYQFKPASEGAYRVISPEGVFCDLFVGSKSALLFDTAYGFGDMLAAIQQITPLPLTVLCSHGHVDHTSGAWRFAGCDIYMHKVDHRLAASHNSVRMRQGSVEGAKHATDHATGKPGSLLPEGFDEAAYIQAGLPALKPIEESNVFDLGGLTLETLHFRGHTSGGIALWNKSSRTIYMGDAMNPFTWLFMPEADPISLQIESIRKAKGLDFDKIALSHAPEFMPKSALDYFLETVEQADFDNGFKFDIPDGIRCDEEVRICTRPGYTPADMAKPGFAAIVVARSKFGG